MLGVAKQLSRWYYKADDYQPLDKNYYRFARKLGKLYDVQYTGCGKRNEFTEKDRSIILASYRFLAHVANFSMQEHYYKTDVEMEDVLVDC